MFLLSALFWGFLALLALGFLLWRFHRFLKWRRKTTLSLRDQLVILLPLLALALALTIPMLPAVFSTWPAKYAELKELTAPVESVQADSRTSSAGRGGRLETRTSYHVFFQGYEGFLCVPDGLRFHQEDFLRWAGSEEVTFLYANTGGKYTVYQIQKGSQDVFLHYREALDPLLSFCFFSLFFSLSIERGGNSGSTDPGSGIYRWDTHQSQRKSEEENEAGSTGSSKMIPGRTAGGSERGPGGSWKKATG